MDRRQLTTAATVLVLTVLAITALVAPLTGPSSRSSPPASVALARPGPSAAAVGEVAVSPAVRPAVLQPPAGLGPASAARGTLASRFASLPFPTLAPVQGPAVPGTGGVAVPYSSAAANASSVAAGFRGANWSIELGIGVALAAPETLPPAALQASPGCSMSWIAPQPSSVTVPATPSTASAGTAAFYEFFLNSSSFPQVLLFVAVVNGTASLWFTDTGNCPTPLGYATGARPAATTSLDSPAAVSIADRAGGTAFLLGHPGATREWISEPGAYGVAGQSLISELPPVWLVGDLAPCGASFEAEIDALTGAVLISQSANCTQQASVTFTESGLPTGTSWSVTFGGSTNASSGSTVGFQGNGTFPYVVATVPGYLPSPRNGTVVVAGSPVTVPITFSAGTTYSVGFHESGLASNTFWLVTLDGTSGVSNTSWDNFTEGVGNYTYSVPTYPGLNETPSSGTVQVVGASVVVPVTFRALTTYPLTFREVGLPAGTLWGVLAFGGGGVNESFATTSTIAFHVANGSYYYLAASGSPYYQTTSYAITSVAGAAVNVTVTFTHRGAYLVHFIERGLPAGSAWDAILGYALINSSTTASFDFVVPNGSYAFTAGGAPGYDPVPPNGTLVVSGAAVTQVINFSAAPSPGTYEVTFSESGLPSGTSWSVNLGGSPASSSGPSIAFLVPNGSYTFTVGSVTGYTASPALGPVVVNGAGVSVQVQFNATSTAQYDVFVNESGLPNGTNWSVTLGASTLHGTGASLEFSEPDGSYTFSVGPVAGYTPSPSTGPLTVSGGPASVTIAFSATTFAVTFTESGLPTGTGWSVTLGSWTGHSTATTLVISVPNGTYDFTVGGAAGYSASPATGSLTVSGHDVGQSVQFRASAPSGSTGTLLGLPSWEVYGLLAAIVVIALAAIAFLVARSRRSAPPTPPTPPAGSG